MRLLRSARSLREQYEGAVQWLNLAIEEFGRILVEDEFLSVLQKDLLLQSVQDILRDMQRNNIDLENLTVSDLGVFANPTMNMKLLTVHGAKGREFDGVAIMGLHEGQIPNWRARTNEEIDEYRRQLYVGITRAKRILIYITDSERARNQPSRFLGRGELDILQ
jgi:DNA helicase-2/ATP-dependent DNA helicase PcrA